MESDVNEDEAWHQLKFLKHRGQPLGMGVGMRQKAEEYVKHEMRKNMRHELKKADREHQREVMRLALYKTLDLPLTLLGPYYKRYEMMMNRND